MNSINHVLHKNINQEYGKWWTPPKANIVCALDNEPSKLCNNMCALSNRCDALKTWETIIHEGDRYGQI